MIRLLLFAVLLELVSLVASNPVTTPEPIVTPPARLRRDESDGSKVLGYYYTTSGDGGPSELTTLQFPSYYEWYYVSSLVQLCDTEVPDWTSYCMDYYPVTCSDSSMHYARGYAEECTLCAYDLVYDGSTSTGDVYTMWACTDSMTDFFRKNPEATDDISTTSSAASSSDSTSASSISSSSSPIPATTAIPGSSSSFQPSPTAASDPDSDPYSDAAQASQKKKKRNRIIGGIIGGLAIHVVAAITYYIIHRRRKKRNQPAYQIAPQMQGPQPPSDFGNPAQSEVSPISPEQNAQCFYGPSGTSKESPISPTVDLNTLSVYSQVASSSTATQGRPSGEGLTRMSAIEDLPELVKPSRSRSYR